MPRLSLLRALTHRNFRLFFLGQTLSLIGTWTQATAMPWLVHRLSGDELILGLVAFSAQIPSFFLPPLAGVIADRVNRHRLLIVTQSLAMAQAFALAALVLTDRVQIWSLVLVNLTLSAINAFDMTARQAFLGDMLDNRDDLANAIALNSSMVHGARLFGPAIAAQLIAWTGEGGCFLANALSFTAVLGALLLMRLPPHRPPDVRVPFFQGLRDGFDYVRGSPPIRATLIATCAVSLFGLSYALLLPVYTHEFLDGSPRTYGWLMTAPGVGAFTAGVLLAWRGLKGVLTRIAVSPVTAGLCLCGFGWYPSFGWALALLFGAGFSFLTFLNSCNMLLQGIADDDKRGRVLSFYSMAFLGMAPIGSLAAGALAKGIGVVGALQVAGIMCMLTGLAFRRSKSRWSAEVRATLRARRSPHKEAVRVGTDPEPLAPPLATEVPPPVAAAAADSQTR